jgi:hypothetical protein
MNNAVPAVRNHSVRFQWRFILLQSIQLFITLASSENVFTAAYSVNPGNGNVHHSCAADRRRLSPSILRLQLFAPPGSGYASSEDYKDIYKSELPDTYEPMMAFPGTMRPGKTPENMPFQDLPIGDEDPDPVPWPHFQQIEWHHRWSEPPHEHPGTMEDFIESLGRWASPEQEAAMRAGVRRDLRQRQEEVESEKRDTIITDDDDDELDDDYEEKEEQVALGDGIYGKLGSDADRAATAAAVAPDLTRSESAVEAGTDSSIDDLFVDDDLEDFLIDLGLDTELDDVVVPDDELDDDVPLVVDTMDDDIIGNVGSDVVGVGVTPAFGMNDEDEFVDTTDMDGDDEDVVSTVPLDDFGDNDSLDVEDIFDEGGFDYDDGDFVGGDGEIW